MDINKLTVGIVGGTGKEGRGIALRWSIAGAQVIIGSRSLERAKDKANVLNQIIGANRIHFAENKDAISNSEFIVFTIPFEHAISTITYHKSDFRPGSILIDATVPLLEDNTCYDDSDEGSGSERLQAHLPKSVHIVAAFKTISAHALFSPNIAEPNPPLDCDEFVASDSDGAKAQ